MLHTLGTVRLERGEFKQSKLLLLLTYLALEGARDRRHLQMLFWGGAVNAANSLRVAVKRLKEHAPGALVMRGTLLGTTLNTDAQELLAASVQGFHERTVELYHGRFLDGLELVDWSPELEEWVYRTREVLASVVRSSLLQLGEDAAGRHDVRLACSRAEAAYLLQEAPEPETEDLRRMHVLMLLGHSALAPGLRREAIRSGINLTWTCNSLSAGLSLGTWESKLSRTTHHVPAQSTSFVGRELELQLVVEALVTPACRLLSIVGPGGIGKTRLVVKLANEWPDSGLFPDGIYFVDLTVCTRADQFAAGVADALAFRLDGDGHPVQQLLRHLGGRDLLLILDNFEQLLPAVPQLLELLEGCSTLKLLVTSREILNVREEWTVPLAGLPFDTLTAAPEQLPAVQLFAHRAKRNGLGFSLGPETVLGVLELCQLLEGSPLAIELAAAWTRLLPVREIVYELGENLDFLTDVNGRNSERHASLRAVFEHSWGLLNDRERLALAGLSVFRGEFTREAAAQVVQVSLPVLASLVDKSLLAVNRGRFGHHPLVYQYAQEKLADRPEDERVIRHRHADHFIQLLHIRRPDLQDSDNLPSPSGLELDGEDIRIAWAWAADERLGLQV